MHVGFHRWDDFGTRTGVLHRSTLSPSVRPLDGYPIELHVPVQQMGACRWTRSSSSPTSGKAKPHAADFDLTRIFTAREFKATPNN